MKLDLPDNVVRRAEISHKELLLILAIQLYADGRIDHTDACNMAQVTTVLNRELTRRDLSVLMYPQNVNWRQRRAG